MEKFKLSYYFFAPNGRFEACGMFTFGHLIATSLCLFFILKYIIKSIKNFDETKTYKSLQKTALILTVLECVKISHSFIYGDLHLDAWFPLSYCGLFIFACWMVGFGNKFLKNIGKSYIAFGCPIAGFAFLIFPTTSLMSFPIWHFFSLYSLLFHSIMIIYGFIFIIKIVRLNISSYFSYFAFIFIFGSISIFMNFIFNSNLMNLREPYNIPINFLQNAYLNYPYVYTLITMSAYLIIPFVTHIIATPLKKFISRKPQ